MEDEGPDSDDDAALDADMMADGDDDGASSDGDEAGAPAALSEDQRAARMASFVKPLEAGQWGASTQLAPSSSTSKAGESSRVGEGSSGPAAAASSFGVDDAQRQRDEIDRQAKLHALGELDAAYAKARPATKIRRPLLEKDSYDGVDSDDESSGGEEPGQEIGAQGGMSGALKAAMARDGLEADDDEDDDMPMVVEEAEEVDMGEEEGEFLKFAREALGLDEQMWDKIVGERQQRGGTSRSPFDVRFRDWSTDRRRSCARLPAFVPQAKASKPKPTPNPADGLKSASLSSKPVPSTTKAPKAAAAASTPAPALASKPTAAPAPSAAKGKEKAKGVSFSDLPPLAQTATDTPDFSNAPMFMPGPEPDEPLPMRTRREKPREIPEGAVPDPSLNSFDAVMAAMDEHLARTKAANAAAAAPAPKASKPKATSAPKAKLSKAPAPAPASRAAQTTPSAKLASGSRERDSLFGSTTKPPLSTPVYDSEDDDGSDDGLGELDPDDPLLQMDAELRAALAAAGDLGSDDEDVDQMDADDQVDYGLIKNFLESYKAQGGMAGPVGNLLGRLAEKKKGER